MASINDIEDFADPTHHPRALDLIAVLKRLDLERALDLRMGGDGDPGETLLHFLDMAFEKPRALAPFWFVGQVSLKEGEKRTRTRVGGFYHSRERAEAAIQASVSSLSENGHYTHVVIEPHYPEFELFEDDSVWFELNRDENRAVPCPKPERLRNIVCFTIG